MNIREIKKEDIQSLAQNYRNAFRGYPWWDHWTEEQAYERLIDQYNTPKFYGMMVEIDGKSVGGILGAMKIQPLGYVYHLEEFFIDPEYQGCGTGTLLYNGLLDRLKSRGVIGIILVTLKDSPAEEFYKKQGAYDLWDNKCLGHSL